MKSVEEMQRVSAPVLVPRFGPLEGMRVLSTGSIVAMPHAANMLADFGAEVIHVERPKVGDTYRTLAPFIKEEGKQVSTSWAQDARNRLSLSLETNMKYPEAKEIFLGLIKNSDIWLENLVWIEKLGISDAMCLEVNPKLVIAHVSGYGRPQFGGVPEYCDRGSYDMVGQAASGWMSLMGDPEPNPPTVTKPWANDYVSAMMTVFGVLIGYINANKTGNGQSVDIAQYEAQARLLCDTFVSYLEAGVLRGRTGNKAAAFQPYDVFRSKDKWIGVAAFGPAVYQRFIKALGLDPDYYTWKECSSSVEAVASEKGQEIDRITREWIGAREASEVEEHMAKFKVPCSAVYDAKDLVESPHWKARENFIEYEDQTLGRNIKAFGITPKLSATPGKVWRGAPTLGQDTDAILSKILGYSQAEIDAIREKGII